MDRLSGRLMRENIRAFEGRRAGGCPAAAGGGLSAAAGACGRGPAPVGACPGLVVARGGGDDLRRVALCALGVGPEFRHSYLDEDLVYNPHFRRDEKVHNCPGGGVAIRL